MEIKDWCEVLGIGFISGIGFAYIGKAVQAVFDAFKKFF